LLIMSDVVATTFSTVTGSLSSDRSARSAVRIERRLEMRRKADEWLKALHSCLFSRM
jgi:hypothetical protein